MRRILFAVCLTSLAIFPATATTARADRAVVWTTASERGLENELNTQAARGLRLAAVSDGLPCTTTVMQAPERPEPAIAYKVIADKDLAAMIGPLSQQGFSPILGHRRALGRAHVIFGSGANNVPGPNAWRLIEFKDLDALPAALTAAGTEGYRPRILVRYPFRSWPGLSETGLILAMKDLNSARELQTVVGQSNKIDAVATSIADYTSKGFVFEMMFTGSRDGSRDARRERLVVALSRKTTPSAATAVVKFEKTTSFGMFGSGVLLGAAPFWDDNYVYAWSPAERRQTWASPIRLSANEATTCLGLELKLRLDAPRDHASTIVGLVAKKLFNNAYELIYITDQRIGF